MNFEWSTKKWLIRIPLHLHLEQTEKNGAALRHLARCKSASFKKNLPRFGYIRTARGNFVSSQPKAGPAAKFCFIRLNQGRTGKFCLFRLNQDRKFDCFLLNQGWTGKFFLFRLNQDQTGKFCFFRTNQNWTKKFGNPGHFKGKPIKAEKTDLNGKNLIIFI